MWGRAKLLLWRNLIGNARTAKLLGNRGTFDRTGLKHTVACIKAIKEVLRDEVGLALDYTPYAAVESYRLVSSNTTTLIHTGEQINLRQGFKDLIDKNTVDIIVISKIFANFDTGARFASVKRHMDSGLSLDLLASAPTEFEKARSRSTILGDMSTYASRVTWE